MSELTWHPIYNIGIHEIDLQHKTLFAMCNNLFTLIDQGAEQHKVEELISDFLGYLTYHNSFEEKLMKVFEYPNLKTHLIEHHAFVAKIRDLLKPHDDSFNFEASAQQRVLESLTEHISGDDLELGSFLAKHIPENVNPRSFVFSEQR